MSEIETTSDNSSELEQTAQNTGKSSDLLQKVEYVTIGGAVIGSVVSYFLQQILWASAPLTLALILNLVNRQKLGKTTQETTVSAITDLQTQVNSVSELIYKVPTATIDFSPAITENFEKLRDATERLEGDVVTTLDWETMNVRLLLMEEAMESLKQITDQQEQFNSDDLNNIQNKITDLENLIAIPTSFPTEIQDELNRIQGAIASLKQNQGANLTANDLTEIERRIAKLTSLIDVFPHDMNRMQDQLAGLQKQIDRLYEHNQKIIKPFLQKLARVVNELQKK